MPWICAFVGDELGVAKPATLALVLGRSTFPQTTSQMVGFGLVKEQLITHPLTTFINQELGWGLLSGERRPNRTFREF